MAEIDKVTYRTHECRFGWDCSEGLRVFREYYSTNWIGIVTHKSEEILYIPASSEPEFESARKVANKVIRHYENVTGDMTVKVNK